MNFAPSLDKRGSTRLTGAVYTPGKVAAALIGFIAKDLPARRLRILEPSVGDGAFLSQLALLLPDHDHVAVDIDEAVVELLREKAALWPPSTTLHARDFIQFGCERIETGVERFDLIIGNPPFIRKHNFLDSFKAALVRLSIATDYPLANLKNSWAAFVVASERLVSDDGIVAFVLPYEFMTVSYGQALFGQMRQLFPRIDLFVSDEKAFPEIEQDAVLFVGTKAPRADQGVFIQRVRNMSDLAGAVEHPLVFTQDSALALDLNAYLLEPRIMPLLRNLQSKVTKFSDLATSAPGVVTAANDFFILTDAKVESHRLERHVLPILKKGSLIGRSPVFSPDDFLAMSKREPCRLLHIKGDIEALDEPLHAYLAQGLRDALHLRYKCRNRKNWYEVRLVERAPGFFFKRSHGYPRLCINAANVYITDTAYGIRPGPGYTIRGICFSFYNSLTMFFAETNGRFYGGGVLELAPSELRELPIPYHEPTDSEFAEFLEVHQTAAGNPLPILDFGDRWLAKHPMVSKRHLKDIRAAWVAVRAHRLRHSSR